MDYINYILNIIEILTNMGGNSYTIKLAKIQNIPQMIDNSVIMIAGVDQLYELPLLYVSSHRTSPLVQKQKPVL